MPQQIVTRMEKDFTMRVKTGILSIKVVIFTFSIECQEIIFWKEPKPFESGFDSWNILYLMKH